jgi:hypothetical protein
MRDQPRDALDLVRCVAGRVHTPIPRQHLIDKPCLRACFLRVGEQSFSNADDRRDISEVEK